MQSQSSTPSHVAICPSSGIGHLTPFLRLASMLSSSNNIVVTVIIIRPTLSLAETNQINTFLSIHPNVNSSEFHTLPTATNTATTQVDPFLLQYDAVSRSSHLLTHHLSTLSPAPTAVFSDLMLASGINKPLAELGIPNYIVNTSSARFFSFMVNLPHLEITGGSRVEVPGLGTIQGEDVPPTWSDRNNMFTRIIDTNCRCLQEAKGIIVNSFEYFEAEAISALQSGKVLPTLPQIFPVGPLIPFGSHKGSNAISWLDNQPLKSVAFVSFGSRTALTKNQIRELAGGLEKCGMRFLWVIKTTIVDKEDKEEIQDLLGEAFFKNTKERGLVVKEWVSQEEILAHSSVGGFVSHCGWNSVMEAAQRGVPLLAWPLFGDQRVNAGVVEKAGLGIWERSWGLGGDKLVKGDEIAAKIKEMMTSEKLRDSAGRVGEEATKAWENDGSSRNMFETIIGNCRKKIDGNLSSV